MKLPFIKACLIPVYIFGLMGFVLILSLVWTVPIQFGFVQDSSGLAPNVSSLWSISNLPIFIITISCSIFIISHRIHLFITPSETN